jgi:sugar O-acyltransferase (sialic acid O-acetyltransferase NeuD family)
MTFNLIIVGMGGLGREVLQYAKDVVAQGSSYTIKGFLDDNLGSLDHRELDLEAEHLGDTFAYKIQTGDRFLLAVADPEVRKTLVGRLEHRGAEFATLIHPLAYVAPSAKISKGCIVSPFATVATFSHLDEHVVLGYYAHVGHDAVVGKYGILSPYAAVNGGSVLSERVFLGTHAVITPGQKIAENVQIAAGSVVYSDIPANRLAVGNPAKLGPKLTFNKSSLLKKDVQV